MKEKEIVNERAKQRERKIISNQAVSKVIGVFWIKDFKFVLKYRYEQRRTDKEKKIS